LATILQHSPQEVVMQSHGLIRFVPGIICGLAIIASGCKRPAGPGLQTTTGTEPRMETVKVDGCLRAGLAENTFVLMREAEPGSGKPATYQLTGQTDSLRDYVGQQVDVSGTLRSEERVATTGDVAVDKPAKGTAGTPTVETGTELDIKQLTVSAIAPTGQRCAPELPPADQPSRRIK
jgi:hypothetical protein